MNREHGSRWEKQRAGWYAGQGPWRLAGPMVSYTLAGALGWAPMTGRAGRNGVVGRHLL